MQYIFVQPKQIDLFMKRSNGSLNTNSNFKLSITLKNTMQKTVRKLYTFNERRRSKVVHLTLMCNQN